MNEENSEDGGWEVASGGRKKSKAKTKQPQANSNITLFQNGANTNTQKPQFKDGQGGQKASQWKLSNSQYASAVSQKKSLSDKKDKNRNNPGSLANLSVPSQPALANAIPRDNSSLFSTAITNKASKSKNVISEVSHIDDLATCPPSNVANGHGTSNNQGESYQAIKMSSSVPVVEPIRDSNGNILDHNLHKNSVIQEANRNEYSRNALIDEKVTSGSCLQEREISSNQLSDRNTSYFENLETTKDKAPVTVAEELPSNTQKRSFNSQVTAIIRENSSLTDKKNDSLSPQSHTHGEINTQATLQGIIRSQEMFAYVMFDQFNRL